MSDIKKKRKGKKKNNNGRSGWFDRGETISLPGRLSPKPFWNPRFYLQMIFTMVQGFNRKNNELKPRVGLSQIGLSCHCERRWERTAPGPFWPNCLSSGRGWLSYCLRCFTASCTCLVLLLHFHLGPVSSAAERRGLSLHLPAEQRSSLLGACQEQWLP